MHKSVSRLQVSLLLAASLIPGNCGHAQISQPRLQALSGVAGECALRLSSEFSSNSVLTLEASTNMQAWREIGTFHDALFSYLDAGAADLEKRFYRLTALPRVATNDWKNQILFPKESFLHWPDIFTSVAIGWAKFIILPDDPARVYYQDNQKYPFHYEFATQRLSRFKGMSLDAFDRVSLYRTNRQAILGSVLYAPNFNYPGGPVFAEYGVQFVGSDPFTPDEVARWLKLVQNSIFASNPVNAFYIPTFEQREIVRTKAGEFAAKGIQVSSLERWTTSNDCYSPGWAVGRLKYFTASDVTAAFSDGRLRPEDILLTDGVPAEMPPVAGIITLAPATPNSHTVILSQSFGIPFVYLSEASDRAQAQALDGHKVLVRVHQSNINPPGFFVPLYASVVKLLDLQGLNDPAFEAQLKEAKRPQPFQFRSKSAYGALGAASEILVPSDIQYFGGKAANYGLLRRAIPDHCPSAIAFSFDLWDAFLDQTMPSGQTLRAEIAGRLAPLTNYPPEMTLLKNTLAGIRDLFTKTAQFSPSQQQAITNAILAANFNPLRKIRFRSSTNVEDSEHFTGAGLYDSFSGCLLDDMDGDTTGPCRCEATEVNERGVLRAIQKVYASFYNDNAFLARLAYQVDETKVGMGVLVHPSFPDEDELANGVATVQFSSSSYGFTAEGGTMTTQIGATSVTNPDGNSTPEVVRRDWGPIVRNYSSLSRLGEPVMSFPWEYDTFYGFFVGIGQKFFEFFPEKKKFVLDFEYKKDRNLGLIIKQVREIPNPAATNAGVCFLFDEPVTLCIAPEEFGDTFTYHRLKTLWTLHTKTMQLASPDFAQGFYTEGTCQYIEDGEIRTLNGSLDSWPNASRSASGTTNYWTTGSGTNQRAWRLETAVTTTASKSQPPVFTQSDYIKTLSVNYARPIWTPWNEEKSSETVHLRTYPAEQEGAFQQRTMVKTNVISIETSFYWPRSASTASMGTPTPNLERFVQTKVTDLTSAPIILTNYFSQTYSTSRHNFYEYFVFEPRLEPGISPAILAELEALDIRSIYVSFQHFPYPSSASFSVIGRDGLMRSL